MQCVVGAGGVARRLFESGWVNAFGWVILCFVLFERIGWHDLATVLLTLVLAEVLGEILVSGSDKGDAVLDWQDTLGRILIRWLALCATVILAWALLHMPLYSLRPLAVVCLLGLSLVIALLKLCRNLARRTGDTGYRSEDLCMFWASGVIAIASGVTPLESDLAILMILFVYLVMVLRPLRRLVLFCHCATADRMTLPATVSSAIDGVFRSADLLLVPFVLPPVSILFYLTARALVQIVPLTINQIEDLARPAILSARETGSRLVFIQAVARINLGVMLVGGGAGLLVVAIANWARSRPLGEMIGQHEVVHWLLLGACARACWGAIPLLVGATSARRPAVIIKSCANLCFFMLCLNQGLRTPTELAWAFGLMQFAATGAIALVLLHRDGIWPAFTALFHRQIRLRGQDFG